MKQIPLKNAVTPAADVFPQTFHRVRSRIEKHASPPIPPKRDNIFSKSRDRREDRGERQMKTSRNPRTLPH